MYQTQPSRPNENRSTPPINQPGYPQNQYPTGQYPQPGYQVPTQPDYPPPPTGAVQYRRKPARRRSTAGCACLLPILAAIGAAFLVLMIYLLFPAQSDILVLGLDYTDPSNNTARTDTIILTTFNPWRPNVGMLSIPRDLWVTIPGVGENRINTAHFFAEANDPGSGPGATMDTIEANFGYRPDYSVRVRFDTFIEIIDVMGGVDIVLDAPMAGYEAGRHHLSGNKALAFARDRAGTDDFFRMQQGQLIVKSVAQRILNPLNWHRLPAVLLTIAKAVDSTVPPWLWPRLAFALLRVGITGVDNRTIAREMVTPWVTDQGASVLLPNWAQINPLVDEMFR